MILVDSYTAPDVHCLLEVIFKIEIEIEILANLYIMLDLHFLLEVKFKTFMEK